MKFNEEELNEIFEFIKKLNDMDFDYVQVHDELIDHTRNSKGEWVEGETITLSFENYEKESPGRYLLKMRYGIDPDER